MAQINDSTGMMFNTTDTNVNINMEGTQKYTDIAKNTNIGDYVDIGKHLQEGGQVFNQMSSQWNKIQAAERVQEANNAKADWVSIYSSEGWASMSANDRLDAIQSNLKDRSEAYTNSFISLSASTANKEAAKAFEDYENGVANSAGVAYEDWKESYSDLTDDEYMPISNREAGKGPEDFVNWYSKKMGVEPVKISAKLHVDNIVNVVTEYTEAENMEDLVEVDKQYEEFKDEFQSEFFQNSKNAQVSKRVEMVEKSIGVIRKQKIEQFVMEAKGRIAEAEKSLDSDEIYGVDPMFILNDFNIAYNKDPLAKARAIKSYEDKATKQAIRVEFLSTNNPLNRKEAIPEEAKEAWQKKVTTFAEDTYNNGQYGVTAMVITNSPGYGKEWGDKRFQEYNQAKTQEELQNIVDKIYIMNSYDRGGTALRQSIGKDNYAEIIAVNNLAKYMDTDLTTARANYNEAKNKHVNFDKELNIKIDKYKAKLGRHAGDYVETLQLLANVNLGMAKQSEPKIREFYLKQQVEYSKLLKDSLKIDTSIGVDPFTTDDVPAGYEKDWAESFLKMSNDALGEGDKEMISLPNGEVQVIDRFGFSQSLKLNVGKFIKLKNKELEDLKAVQGNNRPIVDEVVGATAGGAEKIKEGVENIVGVSIGLMNNISEHFPSMVERTISSFTSSGYKEGLKRLNAVKVLHSTTPRENSDIVEETRDEGTRASDDYAQETNNKIVAITNVAAATVAFKKYEGDYDTTSILHKPTKGSGWTIAVGIDFSQTTRERAIKMGVPAAIIKQADEYGAWGRTDVDLPQHPVRMSEEEWNRSVAIVANNNREFMDTLFETNPNLDLAEQALLATTKHWAGSLGRGDKLRAPDGSYPIQERLNSGYATRGGLLEDFRLIIKDAKEGTARKNRLAKIIEELEGE